MGRCQFYLPTATDTRADPGSYAYAHTGATGDSNAGTRAASYTDAGPDSHTCAYPHAGPDRRAERQERQADYAYGLGALLALVALAVHWTACFWFVVAEMQDYKADGGDTGTAHFALDADNWVVRHGLEDASPRDRYVASLYGVTMMLLGETVDPQTYTERALACLCALRGALARASINL